MTNIEMIKQWCFTYLFEQSNTPNLSDAKWIEHYNKYIKSSAKNLAMFNESYPTFTLTIETTTNMKNITKLESLTTGQVFTFVNGNKVKYGIDRIDSIAYLTASKKVFKVTNGSGTGIQAVEVTKQDNGQYKETGEIWESFIHGKGFNKKIHYNEVEVIGVIKKGVFVAYEIVEEENGRYEFTKGDYTIIIFADNYVLAEIEWRKLQQRNYYPTGKKWYATTKSVNPPTVEEVKTIKTNNENKLTISRDKDETSGKYICMIVGTYFDSPVNVTAEGNIFLEAERQAWFEVMNQILPSCCLTTRGL